MQNVLSSFSRESYNRVSSPIIVVNVTVVRTAMFAVLLTVFALLCASASVKSNSSEITGLAVIYGQATSPPPGYVKINVDLNHGAGGEYIYICYSTTAPGPPITDIQVFAGTSSDFPIQDDYTKINMDLNKGALGKFIYLCYTKINAHPPIVAMDVIQGRNRFTYPSDAQMVRVDQDCSEGIPGYYTYVVYKQ